MVEGADKMKETMVVEKGGRCCVADAIVSLHVVYVASRCVRLPNSDPLEISHIDSGPANKHLNGVVRLI